MAHRRRSANGLCVAGLWCALLASAAGAPIEQDFRVDLPKEIRPVPEPLSEGQTEPGFRFRGTKGWLWRPEQYLAEIPFLARYKLNFLMNCYGSMCDIEHHRWGSPECNRWYEPLPDEKKRAYEKVVRACQEQGIHFCFSMNPNLGAKRILDYDDAGDIDTLWQHYAWMQGLGVKWFNIALDDIREGIDAAGQAKAVNAIFERLRSKDAEAQMIFCPTFYWGNASRPNARAYLETLARNLDEDVYIFWTGDRVVTPVITRAAAEAYKAAVGRRLFIWDNYPVNDAHPTLHLGPVTGRDADLCEVCDGYMSNPLHSENEINRIPLITCADYAYNPAAYDPTRAVGQAILHMADTAAGRDALRDLVELYPGMLVYSKGTNWNPPLNRFAGICQTPHSRYIARPYLRHVEDVAARMAQAFPDRFQAAQKTLRGAIEAMKTTYSETYGQ